jgi:hypothetical protein
MSEVWTEATLPSGLVASIKRLGLFEIDKVEKDIPGPYTYTLEVLNGKSYEVPFDLSVPRVKPEIPLEEVEKNSKEFYNWQEYLRYQEALEHQKKQLEAYASYCERVRDYLIQNCLKIEDLDKLSDEDWTEIYRLSLNPFVSIEEVASAMKHNF